jgi:protein kinase C substrate 80K-H
MYVNDGVCDYELCCDGSDEWAAVGGTKCEDKCKEIGKEWRRLDDIRTKSLRNALKRKEGLLKDAGGKRAELESSIGRLEGEIRVLEHREQDLKKVYEDVERRERGRVVGGSSGKVSKVTVLAGLAKARVEELRTTLLGVVEKRNKLKEKVAELEGILAKFKEERNPNFNDEGVKRAVQAWEDYAANRQGGEDDASERDVEAVSKPDSDSEGINWTEWETEEEESDVDASMFSHLTITAHQVLTKALVYKFEEYLPDSFRSWVHSKIVDFRIMLVENGILADNANSGSESKAVSDARASYQAISDDLNAKRVTLGESQTDLSKDYGPNDIFRALKGVCVSKDSGEYEYELCWLDNTKQKSKKGGGSTGMGNFVRFDKGVYDEEVGADGKGVGKGERVIMMYENGQHCWNGPNRQTTVVLACAEKDEIWRVVEQEKCMYRMDVGTAAVCEKAGSGSGEKGEGKDGKDEL